MKPFKFIVFLSSFYRNSKYTLLTQCMMQRCSGMVRNAVGRQAGVRMIQRCSGMVRNAVGRQAGRQAGRGSHDALMQRDGAECSGEAG